MYLGCCFIVSQTEWRPRATNILSHKVNHPFCSKTLQPHCKRGPLVRVGLWATHMLECRPSWLVIDQEEEEEEKRAQLWWPKGETDRRAS